MEWKIKKFEELTGIELYGILKLRSEIFVVEQNCVYLDPDGKDILSWHLFCIHNNEVIACCRILPENISYKEISLGRIASSEKYRGHGLGKELVQRAIIFVTEELNQKDIRISAQSYLMKFYASLGFKQVSDEYMEDNICHTEMLYTKK